MDNYVYLKTNRIITKKMKKCPYCGEEILQEAKKCKHCNEWLNQEKTIEETHSVLENKSFENYKVEKQNFGLLKTICFLAMVTAFISGLHSMEIHGIIDISTNEDSSKSRLGAWLIGTMASVPEWFVVILDSAFWTVLLLAIRKLYLNLNFKEKAPFIALIVFEIGLGFLNTIVDLIKNDDVKTVFALLVIIIIIPYLIIMSIIGIKMLQINEMKSFSKLGFSMIIYSVGSVLFIILASFFGLNSEGLIYNGIYFILTIYPLLMMKTLFSTASYLEN